LMHRNLDRRVESMVRISQADHKRMLMRALDSYFAPTTACWHMQTDGTWKFIGIDEAGAKLPAFHSQVVDWYRARE